MRRRLIREHKLTGETIDGFTDLDFADYFEPLPVADTGPVHPQAQRIAALKQRGLSSEQITAIFARERLKRPNKGVRRAR